MGLQLIVGETHTEAEGRASLIGTFTGYPSNIQLEAEPR